MAAWSSTWGDSGSRAGQVGTPAFHLSPHPLQHPPSMSQQTGNTQHSQPQPAQASALCVLAPPHAPLFSIPPPPFRPVAQGRSALLSPLLPPSSFPAIFAAGLSELQLGGWEPSLYILPSSF